MLTDHANIEMIGFENDGGLNEVFVQFGIPGDYKSGLPMHLTEILRKQAPGAVVTRIELLGEPSCNFGGMRDEENESLIRVEEFNVPLALRVMVHDREHRSSLDLELILKCEALGDTPRVTTDMFVKNQTRLE